MDAVASINSHAVIGLSRSASRTKNLSERAYKLPVDLAQFIARLIGAVLRELQARTAAAAVMLAEALPSERASRGQAEFAQACAYFRGDQLGRRHWRAQAPGKGTPRNSAATTSSALRPSASAVNESSRRWRSTGAASAITSSRVAAKRPCSKARAFEASTSD